MLPLLELLLGEQSSLTPIKRLSAEEQMVLTLCLTALKGGDYGNRFRMVTPEEAKSVILIC